MKKILLSLMLCVFMSTLVLAQGQQGIHEPGTGIEDPELKESGQGQGKVFKQQLKQRPRIKEKNPRYRQNKRHKPEPKELVNK